MGDAYIVAGILPKSAADGPAGGVVGTAIVGDSAATPRALATRTRDVCARMLRLGGVVLEGMAACRRETGLDVHGRVGIAIGSAVLGALGKLQPRFHMMGQVPSQTTPRGCRCSHELFCLLALYLAFCMI